MSEITNCGVTLIKRFTYRGDSSEEWSNHYWLTGSPPATDEAWHTLVDELASLEAGVFSPQSFVVGAYGYITSETDPKEWTDSVFVKDYTLLGAEIPGRLSGVAEDRFAGDQVGLVSWKTTRRSKGKAIYLRKYLHSAFCLSTDPDSISALTLTAYQDYAQALMLGNWAGGRRLQSHMGPETLLVATAHPYVTTRTLKRRGKRPKVAQ